MKKKILFLLPFILYLLFYLFIITIDGVSNFNVLGVISILSLLLITSLGLESKKKKLNIYGFISLIFIVLGLILVGIDNYGFFHIETITGIAILFYYLIIFNLFKKKRTYLLIITLILVTLFFPIKFQYKDGGTVEYSALTYKIIKWNKLKNYGRIKTGIDVILFPNNIHSIDYYDTEIEPPELAAFTKGENEKYIICNVGSYNWSKEIDGQILSTIADSIDPINFNYKDYFTILNTEKIDLTGGFNISDIKVKSLNNKDYNYQTEYNSDTESFNFDNLQEGEYVIAFRLNEDDNYAYYAFKIKIIKE